MTAVGAPCLRADDGSVLELPAHRWFAPADDTEVRLLTRLTGPVLDVGCGPGRHLAVLAELGVDALGIDVSPGFLDVARRAGLDVLQRCVFAPLPEEGTWMGALLLDGNVGIGGDPHTLLTRLAEVLHPHGRLLVELAPDDAADRTQLVRTEHGPAEGPWFPWTVVGPRRLAIAARATGWTVLEQHVVDDRHFALMARR